MFNFVIYFVLVCLIFVLFIKYRQTYWKRKKLFQLEPEFFFGNSRPVITGKVSISDHLFNAYQKIKDSKQKHGGMYQFLVPIYVPIDPFIIKNIIQKDFSYFMDHGFYHHPKDILSGNLFSLEGEVWKQLRMKLTPTFTSGKMKMMFETLIDKTNGLTKVITEYVEKKEPIVIKDVLGRYTTDIIGSCAFGIECNSLDDPNCAFRKYGKKIFEPQLLQFLLVSVLPWWFLGNIGFKASGRDVTHFFTNLVKETIKYREGNNIQRKDFMDLLIQLKNTGILRDENNLKKEKKTANDSHTITENEIIAQCFVFFLAGFETSSTTMTFALLELAQNQEIQKKARDEIDRVLKNHGGKMTYDAVMEMVYLDKVIYETLRKYPPLPMLPRVCNKTYTVPGTTLVIDKGVHVRVPIWGIHKDPDYYPNPEVFNPENFNDENKAKRPDFTFLPFGEGPRMCIGLRFGMLQTKVGLISLLRNYNFTLNKKTPLPIKMDLGLIMSVKGDVWLDVTKA